MKTSQLKSIFAFLLFAAVTFTSCKKDAPDQPQDAIVGSWVGKYGIGNSIPFELYSFNILPDGVLHIRDSDKFVTGIGTWTLSGGTFHAKYTYELGGSFSMAAKHDPATNTITGSWGEGEATDAGEFFLNKE